MQTYTIEQFVELNRDITVHNCSKCGADVELVMKSYEVCISGKEITFNELPQLQCTVCYELHLSDHSKGAVMYYYNALCEKGIKRVDSKFNHLNKRYPFCTEHNFIYDYVDYENIPGLTAITGDGFLTPVYFDRSALNFFQYDPNYKLNLGSETYGEITVLSSRTRIPFGINTNKKVVMWLGDLDQLDHSTLTFLKLKNVNSDHTLIGSEFYYAQIGAVFSQPTLETQTIQYRNKLYDLLRIHKQLELNHLDDEVIVKLRELTKPVTYTDIEIKSNVNDLNQILLESINKEAFRDYYKSNALNADRNYKSWGSVKLYEFLLLHLSNSPTLTPELNQRIGFLYVLYDLRTLYFHNIDAAKQDTLRSNIVKTLGLSSFEEKERLYSVLINGLCDLFRFMCDCLLKSTTT